MPFAVEISGFFGALMLLIGVWGVLAPARLSAFVGQFASKGGLWVAVVIRIVLGLALWFAASASRAPLLLEILGVLALVAAAVLPFIGQERFERLIAWWTNLSASAKRFNALFAVAFGAAVLWALLPSAA